MRLHRPRPPGLVPLWGATLAAIVFVWLAQVPLWPQIIGLYPGDDFWNLSGIGGAGLALLTSLLIALLTLGAALVSRRIAVMRAGIMARILVDAGIKVTAFAALHLAAPQLFYTYYRFVIDGLPQQWVIRAPNMKAVQDMVLMTPAERLAEHAAGAVLWGLVLAAIWTQMRPGPGRWAFTALAIAAAPSALRVSVGFLT